MPGMSSRRSQVARVPNKSLTRSAYKKKAAQGNKTGPQQSSSVSMDASCSWSEHVKLGTIKYMQKVKCAEVVFNSVTDKIKLR